MLEHVSAMELYIILSNLDMFERWNQTVLITKYQQMKQCTQNKYFFNYFLSSTGMPHPEEFSNDVAPYPRESSMEEKLN